MDHSSEKKNICPKDVDLIVYDFDGVMTDNRALIMQDGTEAVMVNRSDGLAVSKIRSMQIPQLILSTETNPVVNARAAKLKLQVISSCDNKKDALLSFCWGNGYDLKKVIYVGTDINDAEAMRSIGFPVAPADAHPDILKIAKYVTKAKGGYGVVRELLDILNGLRK